MTAPPVERDDRRASPLQWIGAGAILFSALARMFVAPSTTPWWELDPLIGWRPETTLTPALCLALDALVWSAAAAIISAERAVRWRSGLLALAGCVGVLMHATILRPPGAGADVPRGDFLHLLLGSSWAAAVIGAWALLHPARDPRLRAAATSVIAAALLILFAKGAYQTLVEHPRVVAAYDANPTAMLAAKGWDPDSAQARLFERRLRQPEATGWFGLSNVYGSVAAAGAVLWLAFSAGAIGAARRRAIGSGEAGAIALFALAALSALAMSRSKGALGAFAIGVVCLIASLWMRRLAARRAGSIGVAIALAVPLLVLLGVALRGAVGDSLTERSLLFRSQYFAAATQIFAHEPITGVGPAGFKNAYVRVKSPLSPEEVDSPHSLPFDWLARLGLFGGAWLALWMIWLTESGRRLGAHKDEGRSLEPHSRATILWVALITCGALALGLWLERAALAPDSAAWLLFFGALAVVAAALMLRALRHGAARWLDRALAAGALALAAHAMIEVTPVTPGAACWFFALFALAAAHGEPTAPAEERPSAIPSITLTLLLAAGGAAVVWRTLPVRRWEAALQSAAAQLRDLGQLHDALSGAPGTEAAAARALAEAARRTGRPAPASNAEVDRIFQALRAQTVPLALTKLDRAASIEPTAWEPRLAAARLELALAFDLASQGRWDQADRRAGSALRRVSSFLDTTPRSVAAAGRRASFHDALVRLSEGAPDRDARLAAELPQAIAAWERVAELDPHGLTAPLALWRLSLQMGDAEQTRRWGERALEVDRALRLDPLKGLTDPQRDAIRQSLQLPSAVEPGGAPS